MMEEINKNIYRQPVELLQQLIRLNTSNPPGNERECITYLSHLLEAAGIEVHLLSKESRRPNLVARLRGKKDVSPLLLYGHVDVVPADGKDWKYPPFEAKVADGFVWGRGALDMKGAVTMMICAFMKAKTENLRLPGDVVLCLLSDEEDLGECGARFLVDHHPEIFKNIRYALGEFGGFTLYVSGKKFYPIEIAQKQKCIIKAIVRGPGGHGSALVRDGAMAKLSKFLDQLDKSNLPVHITSAAKMMFNAMADALPFPTGWILRQLLNPKHTDFILKSIMGEKGNVFVPMFHNTVNATMLKGSERVNVIPSEIEVQMDVRLLPGLGPDDVINELRPIVGDDVTLEVVLYDAGPADPDMSLFNMLADILKEADPDGIPVPLLLTASSDARFFSRLGIQTYGFTPMQLPEDMNFNRTIHAIDERIPVNTLEFGINALYQAMQRF